MAAFQISFGDNNELEELMKKVAEKAVKEAIEAEQPIRPVVQQVIQKTVEHVTEGTALELAALHRVKTVENAVAVGGAVGVIVAVGAMFKWLSRP